MAAGLQVFNESGTLLFDSTTHNVLTFQFQFTFYRSELISDGDYMVYRDPRIKVGMVCLPLGYGGSSGGVTGIVRNGSIAITPHDYNNRMGNTYAYVARFLGVGG